LDVTAARGFILRSARLLDRHRFAFLFDHGDGADVLSALRPYQNGDGGFGHALEPDLRGGDSQPVSLEHALQVLDEVGDFDNEIVQASCDWLTSVTTDTGGVPFVLASVTDSPHAPWWVPTDEASLNPTAGIAGLLHKHDVRHPWLSIATDYCWRALSSSLDTLGPDDAISVLTFLEHVADRVRADSVFEQVGARISRDLVALDPSTTGYVKMPLEFAPDPDRRAARLFSRATLALHLDMLASLQGPDGGWPITWETLSGAATQEWRGFMTIKSLQVLRNYGRLPPHTSNERRSANQAPDQPTPPRQRP
jgi:hypothetical protein